MAWTEYPIDADQLSLRRNETNQAALPAAAAAIIRDVMTLIDLANPTRFLRFAHLSEEAGRIVGYAGADFFWAELDRLYGKAGFKLDGEPQQILDRRVDSGGAYRPN